MSEQVKNRIRAAFEKARHLGPSSLVPAPPKEPDVTPAPVELSVRDQMRAAFDKARQPIVVPKKKKVKYDQAQFSSLRARGLSEGEIRSLAYTEADEFEFTKHAEALVERALQLPEVQRQHHVRTLHQKSFDVGTIHHVSRSEYEATIRECLNAAKNSPEQGKKEKS